MPEIAENVPTIWYMGAKTRLLGEFILPTIREVAPEGSTVLDLATGTGVVAAALAPRHRVIANDIQAYGEALARARIVHEPGEAAAFAASLDPEADLGPARAAHGRAMEAELGPELAREEELLEGGDPEAYRRWLAEQPARDWAPALRLRRTEPDLSPAILCTAYYAHVYFGLRQAVTIDGIREAIASIGGDDPDAARRKAHYLACLLHAASRRTSSTSHFAQPLDVGKDRVCRHVMERRTAPVDDLFADHSAELASAVGTGSFRAGNETWCLDFVDALERARETTDGVACVYLDPPYTRDNYSRFYHVLETIARYDYPPLARRGGSLLKGRYPVLDRRHRSPFCSPRTVEEAFRRTVHGSADLGAALVVSYSSTSGLLFEVCRERAPGRAEEAFLEVFRERYGRVRLRRRSLLHSGQGDSNHDVEEILVVCRDPRPGRG